MEYKEAVELYGPRLAEALSDTEYNQHVRGKKQVAADVNYLDFDSDYIGIIESIGHRKAKKVNEKLRSVEEGIQISSRN